MQKSLPQTPCRCKNFNSLVTKESMIKRAFITSQFSYCSFVWMCHSRTVNNKTNKLQGRALRLVYDDRESTFEELHQNDKSLSIHHQNLQVLATEKCKVYSYDTLDIINDIF